MGDTYCTKCILSSSFPGIEFDDQGVCNFCRDQLCDTTSHQTVAQQAQEVRDLINRVKGQGEYDAVLCYSGGKDSTYTMKLAVEKYGLKVLAFTLDNGFLSNLAVENIHRIVESLGVDLQFFRPSKGVYKNIIKTSLTQNLYPRSTARRISSGCQSCISIVNNIALKMAMEKEIPLVLAGFTLGQIPVNSIYYQNDYNFLAESRKKPLEILQKEVGDGVLPYLTIPQNTVNRVRMYPYTVNLLVMEEKSEAEIIKEISTLGWVQPKDVDGCSSNCRLNVANNHVHKQKYGFNPYELELSHLIRAGQLTREEALAKINDQSPVLLAQVLQELGMPEKA